MTPKCPDCKRDQDDCVCASPASAPEALDWLETELSAISCHYHGDPSYDHDAYWMRERVEKLLEEARKLFAAPTPPVSEDRKDAERFREGWTHACNALCMEIALWIERCPHCGMPAPKAPAMQEDKP